MIIFISVINSLSSLKPARIPCVHYLSWCFSVAVIVIVYFTTCRRKAEKGEPFDEDYDDDIRENVMYYNEEGASM